MTHGFRAAKITDKVYWVGVIDRALKDFHGYGTPNGSTYNAYLILDDKVVLVDTVKKPLFGEMMRRISSIIDPKEIDIIVSNHSEMDHTGALPETIAAVDPEVVLASKKGVQAISEQFDGLMVDAVDNLQELSIGSLTLKFIETRMLHWPDSMVTWIPELSLLFSQDIMGMHLATGGLLAHEHSEELLRYEAAKYYANIVMPYSQVVARTMDKLGELGVAPEIVATDHGPVWHGRHWVDKIFGWYRAWSAQAPVSKAVVVYDTMWGSTALLAKAISEGLREGGCHEVIMAPLASVQRSDVAAHLLEAGALLVGSPTINNQMFPSVADVLTYLKGLKPKNLVGAAFGSYGWSGEGVKYVAEMMEDMRIDMVDTMRVKYVPGDEDLYRARMLGVDVARRLAEKIEAAVE